METRDDNPVQKKNDDARVKRARQTDRQDSSIIARTRAQKQHSPPSTP